MGGCVGMPERCAAIDRLEELYTIWELQPVGEDDSGFAGQAWGVIGHLGEGTVRSLGL